MLLWGAMLEVGLEIEPEVGCIRGCGGGCARGCAEGVCAEGVQRVCVRRLCGGYVEVLVDGGMSVCPMSEHVWWLYRSMCQRMWWSMCGGLRRVCGGLWRVRRVAEGAEHVLS